MRRPHILRYFISLTIFDDKYRLRISSHHIPQPLVTYRILSPIIIFGTLFSNNLKNVTTCGCKSPFLVQYDYLLRIVYNMSEDEISYIWKQETMWKRGGGVLTPCKMLRYTYHLQSTRKAPLPITLNFL